MPRQLNEIAPGQTELTIRARICRLWRARILFPTEKYDGLQCVLVDRANNAILATVREMDYEDVKDKIAQGMIYEITNFHSVENASKYIIIPHQAQLMFNNRTKFTLLPEVNPPYPLYYFKFTDFEQLAGNKNNDITLFDVIGRLKTVYAVDHVRMDKMDSKLVPKRTIEIENIRGEELSVTLWGSLGVEFDVASVSELPPPVVIVITSNKVRIFDKKIQLTSGTSTCIFINPEIPEIGDFKNRFSDLNYAPNILSEGPKKKQRASLESAETDLVDIRVLNSKTQEMSKNKSSEEVTYFIKGEVTKLMTRDGWYYTSCSTCGKLLKPEYGSFQFKCDFHPAAKPIPAYKVQVRVEDSSDSVILMALGRGGESLFGIQCEKVVNQNQQKDINDIPAELKKVLNQTKIFEVGRGNRTDFLIKTVYHESEQTSGASSQVSSTEKSPSKRSIEISDQTYEHPAKITKSDLEIDKKTGTPAAELNDDDGCTLDQFAKRKRIDRSKAKDKQKKE